MRKTLHLFLLCASAAVLLSTIVSIDNTHAADSSTINIAYSSNMLGYYEPCGCLETGEQLGGLYKKAVYLEQYRKDHGDVVVVDSGDLLNEDPELPETVRESAKLKADLIVRIFSAIGIDAVSVGELDLVLGLNTLKELEKKYNFPFVSANLVDENNKPIFKRYIIKKVNGKNVGVFGIIGDTSEMATKVSEITGGAVNIQDPLEAAASIVKELAGKVDYMVALTHQGTNRDWVIARRIQGIDLVVGGHDKQATKEPNVAGKTLIVQAGEKAQYLGMIQIANDGSKTAHNTLVPFGDSMASDPKIKAMINDYNDKVAAMYSEPGQNKPVGGNVVLRLVACEACHADKVAKWKTTDHAKAYQTLAGKSKQFDPDCLACHTTRFEQPEGFTMKLQQPELANVQCETCHGFAKEHLSDMKPIPTPKPAMALCLKCHTPYRSPGFEKNAMKVMAKIKH
jgi:2',3'-cyclic-nucleotide 2'-phosphodiesterase (5'-nucleotidase family)